MNGLGSKMKKSQPLTPDEGSEAVEDATGMVKHYPWLSTFDMEAKSRLTVPDVTSMNVLKLIALLESNVSPEVTRLKNKPNRATKFLGQVRRRISMVKMGGYMTDRECELQLFPIYGLLLTHIVNITLNSSKIEKYGAQQVAQEIYYFLKLMFQEDTEFVLDVALCSTLDEHATSKHKVGFQLFSFIVEDWRCYSGTHSSLMKYCAVCSLLSESSYEGEIFVERNVPSDIDRNFPKFLSRTLNIDFNGINKKKAMNLKTIIKAIKATPVKSISRSRLVLVSKKDVAKTMRDREKSPDVSDAESIASTVINVSKSKFHQEQPSSSGRKSRSQEGRDDVNSILGELGLDLGFSLDNVGSLDLLQGSSSGTAYIYDRDILTNSLTNEEDCLVSSTVSPKADTGAIKTEVEAEEEMASDNELFVPDAQNGEADDEAEQDNLTRARASTGKGRRAGTQNDDGKNERDEDEDMIVDVGQDRRDPAELFGGHSGYEPSSDHEQYSGSHHEMEDDAESDDDSDYGDVWEASKSKSKGMGTLDKLNKQLDAEDDDDSDLEVLSVKVADDHNDDMSSNASRDEAEPESGEDYVPDYTKDTDDEDEEVDVDEKKTEKEQEKAEPAGEENTETLDTSLKDNQQTPSSPSKEKNSERENQQQQKESESQELQSQQSQNYEFSEVESSVVSVDSAMCPPKRAPRKSTRAMAMKAASNRDSSQSSTMSSEGTPSKQMKLNKADASDSETNDDVEGSQIPPATQSSQSESETLPVPTPRGRGRGRGRKSLQAPAVSDTSSLSVKVIGVATRRTTRSTRAAGTSGLNASISAIANAGRGRRRSVTKAATPAADTEETKKTPSTATRGRGRGRGRGGHSNK